MSKWMTDASISLKTIKAMMQGTPPILYYGTKDDLKPIEQAKPIKLETGEESHWKEHKPHSISYTITIDRKAWRALWKKLYGCKHTFDITQPHIPQKRKKRIKRDIARLYRVKTNKIKFKYPKK